MNIHSVRCTMYVTTRAMLVLFLFVGITACSSNTASLPIAPAVIASNGTMIRLHNANALSVAHSDITSWFMNQSQLCVDGLLLNGTLPCSEIAQTLRFTNVYTTPSAHAVAFTLQSSVLTPDTVVGIFTVGNNTVTLLGNYYLGNEVLGFSPNGEYLAFMGNCFEARCGIVVVNTASQVTVSSVNNPEFIDERQYTAHFMRWLNNNSIEYTLQDAVGTVVEKATAQW